MATRSFWTVGPAPEILTWLHDVPSRSRHDIFDARPLHWDLRSGAIAIHNFQPRHNLKFSKAVQEFFQVLKICEAKSS